MAYLRRALCARRTHHRLQSRRRGDVRNPGGFYAPLHPTQVWSRPRQRVGSVCGDSSRCYWPRHLFHDRQSHTHWHSPLALERRSLPKLLCLPKTPADSRVASARCNNFACLVHGYRTTAIDRDVVYSAASRHFGPGAALGRTRRLNLEESACAIPSVLPLPARRRHQAREGLADLLSAI